MCEFSNCLDKITSTSIASDTRIAQAEWQRKRESMSWPATALSSEMGKPQPHKGRVCFCAHQKWSSYFPLSIGRILKHYLLTSWKDTGLSLNACEVSLMGRKEAACAVGYGQQPKPLNKHSRLPWYGSYVQQVCLTIDELWCKPEIIW